MSSLTAPVKWAQRKDSLYVTISLPDVKDHTLDVTENKLVFSGTSNDQKYSVDLEFYKPIDTEESIMNVLPMNIQMKLMKKDKDEDFWPRLLQDKHLEKTNVKIDWDRYVDEDEEDEGFDTSNLNGGMGLGGMGGMEDMFKNMGGMGGADGMDDDDEADSDDGDDDDMPDLEPTGN